MRASKRVLKYAMENYTGVSHTTLDPEGPGVIRIHLIPPRVYGHKVEPSVVILNGQDILPVNVSWSILLNEFIKEVNKYEGREINDNDTENIIEATARSVSAVYPFISKKRFKRDIARIMKTFVQVSRGEIPDEPVGYMTMGEYAPQMRAPHRMDLMVSAMTRDGKWHCNQQCVHCYAAGQVNAEEKELTTDEWKKILDKCQKACTPQVTFTGGEPTMREDLFELIDHARWFVTRLNTNGIRLTKDYCRHLKEASLDSLQITFYSADKEVHNRLVGADEYENTSAGIKNAIAAGLSVSINTPLCTLNRDYVKTLEFLHGLGVRYVTCSGLITTGNAREAQSEILQLSREELKGILKDAVEYVNKNEMEISFTSPGWIEGSFFEELGITTPVCGACLSNMAITPGGNVVPCQSWLSDETLGNMLTDKWDSIWDSEICASHRRHSSQMAGDCPLRVKRGGAAKKTADASDARLSDKEAAE